MKISIGFIFFFALVDIAFGKFLPKQFEANLEQVVFSSVHNKEVKTPVKMKYLFPNNIYFSVTGENPVVYVCNHKKTWMYNPPWDPSEKGEVKIGDSSRYCYVKLFDALSNGLSKNNLYSVKSKNMTSLLTFSKKAKEQLNIGKVELEFKKQPSKNSTVNDLKSMKVFYLDKEKPVKFQFKEITKTKKLSSDDFIFKVPKNTNISTF